MNFKSLTSFKSRFEDFYSFFFSDIRNDWLAIRQPQYLIKEYDGLALGGDPTTSPGIIKWASSQIDVYGFNGIGVKTERRTARFILPGNYVEGSDIVPVIHWGPSTAGAGNIVWQMNYEWISDGQAGSAGVTIQINPATFSVAWLKHTNRFPTISGTGKLIGSLFHFNLFRDPSADTYGADAALLNIGFFQKINTFGSRTDLTK